MIETVSVSQFISQINGIIAGEFCVEGEVSQYKISQGKWIFFDLKDATATLNCFSTVFMLRQPLEEGMKVRVVGYPSIHSKSGRFSFTVQQVEVVGEGSLKRAYELLKAKLAAEGLFASERKRPIPRIPSRIGVIASRDSAAFGDFKKILNNRWGGVEVVLRHVQVQGEVAVADIVRAFHEFNEYDGPFDVLVLIRGGGSLEDLAAFNSEEVVRAVYGSKVPVVCGVGHERDESLADLAADVRASTPSNAAERVVPDRSEFSAQLTFEIESVSDTLLHRIRMLNTNLAHHAQILQAVLKQTLLFKKQFVLSAQQLLNNVDHRVILQRGYSITRTTQGLVVRSEGQVKNSQKIVVELADGEINAQVV